MLILSLNWEILTKERQDGPMTRPIPLVMSCVKMPVPFVKLLNFTEKPTYCVFGNHDTDLKPKEEILKLWKSKHDAYYSFDVNGFHFVVLDPNYVKMDDEYIRYDHGRYYKSSRFENSTSPYVPPEQLAWLKEDLAKTLYPSILFSHQRLTKGIWGILNYEEVEEILQNAPNKVLLSMHGHEHMDYAEQKNGIWHYSVNSISMFWLDAMFTVLERYTPELDEEYPQVRYTVPYSEPVFAIVTLDEDGATIQGTKADFVGISPEEQGVYGEKSWYYPLYQEGKRITPSIEDCYLPFK